MQRQLSQLQPHCVCINLRRLARLTTAMYDEALSSSGIKLTQYSLLCAVERAQPVAITALAEELDLDRTTLARNLAPLQRDALIQLQAAATDRRITEVRLTRAGRGAIARARPQWERAQAQVTEKIGSERAAMLRALATELSTMTL
jgi:DNA-binding MarR family transcriptional regulator